MLLAVKKRFERNDWQEILHLYKSSLFSFIENSLFLLWLKTCFVKSMFTRTIWKIFFSFEIISKMLLLLRFDNFKILSEFIKCGVHFKESSSTIDSPYLSPIDNDFSDVRFINALWTSSISNLQWSMTNSSHNCKLSKSFWPESFRNDIFLKYSLLYARFWTWNISSSKLTTNGFSFELKSLYWELLALWVCRHNHWKRSWYRGSP